MSNIDLHSIKVLQNRTVQLKTEPTPAMAKKVKSKDLVWFRFSLPVSLEAFGFTREIEFLPHAREREGGRGRGSNRI